MAKNICRADVGKMNHIRTASPKIKMPERLGTYIHDDLKPGVPAKRTRKLTRGAAKGG